MMAAKCERGKRVEMSARRGVTSPRLRTKRLRSRISSIGWVGGVFYSL
jgi:hypothetical protein